MATLEVLHISVQQQCLQGDYGFYFWVYVIAAVALWYTSITFLFSRTVMDI